jgi:hypothetical protein
MWLKFLLWITLIYPFIWLFKRFHPRGGGRWQVCGAAYAYKRLVKVDSNNPNLKNMIYNGEVVRTRDGIGYLQVLGTREGQWFKAWESTIRENVMGKVQTEDVVLVPNAQRAAIIGSMLDGFTLP